MNKLNDKITIFDLESYKESIRKKMEEDIRYEIEYDVYYGVFSNMPVNVLCEQFIRIYKGTGVDYSTIDEKGFCLMHAIVSKTCDYIRDCKLDWLSD